MQEITITTNKGSVRTTVEVMLPGGLALHKISDMDIANPWRVTDAITGRCIVRAPRRALATQRLQSLIRTARERYGRTFEDVLAAQRACYSAQEA